VASAKHATRARRPPRPEDETEAATDALHVPAPETGETWPPAFDRLIHERMRLGIVSALAVNHALSFSDLKKLMDTTDGNLSVHARKLEDAGYIECHKFFAGRQPKTEYRLTARGRAALGRYLDHMEALIEATRGHA
jgi:DNA-binding HxlR family transcriptional regulator